MATINTTVPTLLDVASRLDPNGSISAIAELLSQTNSLLEDMPFIEGNLPTGHRTTIRTGLPTVYWRLLNRGVPTSKSRTAQVDEAVGMLEARSEVDVDLASLNGNTTEFRLSEGKAFLEAMNQEMASTLFYGNSTTDPEEFNGLSVRYSSLSAGNAQNILSAGDVVGGDATSMWLVVWSPETVTGIYPKGSIAGLTHEDLGVGDAFDGDNNRFRAWMDLWKWKCGVTVRDWRYAVRICNIDTSALNDDTAGTVVKMQELMIRAMHRIPNLGMGRPVFYCNRDVRQALDLQALSKASNTLTIDNYDGRLITSFRGVPVKTVDSLLASESTVS